MWDTWKFLKDCEKKYLKKIWRNCLKISMNFLNGL